MGSTQKDDDSATVSDHGETTKTDSDSSETETDDELPSPSLYTQGERVIALHELRAYDAKVMRVEYRMKKWYYFVHYTGWNKNWDEWVVLDRLMKYNEENVEKMHNINKKQDQEKKAKLGRASQIKPKTSNVARGKKRKNDSLTKDKGAVLSEKLVNLQIPPTLKKQLVDDCEFISHLGKLVKLPRRPNVDDILKKYQDYRLKKDGSIADESVREILKGLRCYFDKALPAMLLYQSERKQYLDTIKADVPPSIVYGAEHLLRLFVKLPELLVHANIEEETITELQQNLVDFLKFLQKNQSNFFLSTYHVPEDTETSTNKQE